MISDLWWGTPKQFTPLMWKEVAAMQACFNPKLGEKGFEVNSKVWWDQTFYICTYNLKLNVSENPDEPFWRAEFRMRESRGSSIGSRDRFTLRIQYARNHPASEPGVTIPSHHSKVLSAPHTFPGGLLCLHDHSSTRTGWDPARSTAATFALWSVEWIRAWLYYKRHDRWPTEG